VFNLFGKSGKKQTQTKGLSGVTVNVWEDTKYTVGGSMCPLASTPKLIIEN